MNDLTLLYIHADKLPEQWVAFHKEQLDKLPYPIIDLYDEKKMGEQMIYQRLLEGCKKATTPFIAVIEDDALYPPEHFKFRPKMDEFAYNKHRWSLFTFDNGAVYSIRQRVSNCVLIAPRELAIEALEERNTKWPNGWKYVGELGRWRIDRILGTQRRKLVEWYSDVGVVHLNHPMGTEELQKISWKTHGEIKALDVPFWGKSCELVKKFI